MTSRARGLPFLPPRDYIRIIISSHPMLIKILFCFFVGFDRLNLSSFKDISFYVSTMLG
jgi:hypothetical protein